MIQSWLDVLCESLPKVRSAVVLDDDAAEAPVLARWPQGTGVDEALRDVAALVRRGSGSSVAEQAGSSEAPLLRVGRRLDANGPVIIALEIEVAADQQPVVVRLVDWSIRWLDLIQGSGSATQPARDAAELDVLLDAPDLDSGLTAWATELSRVYALERVIVARCRNRESNNPEIVALSHALQLDRRAQFFRDIESGLESLLEKSTESTAPANLEINDTAFLVCWLRRGQDCLGAVLIETRKLPEEQNLALQRDVARIAAIVDIRGRLEQSATTLLVQSFRKWAAGLVGPRFLPLKIAFVALVVLLPLLSVVPGTHVIASPAVLEGRLVRSVVAPFSGYVEAQYLRSGELVEEGDVIAELDDRELELEREQWVGALAEAEQQYRQALAQLDQTQAQIFQSQLRQARARLDLIESQLARTRLVAPVSGIIISGDLSRALGAPVERGDVLFEIAPVDDYRVAVRLPERAISRVSVGLTGELRLDALPGTNLNFEVEHIADATEAADGSVVYRVEGSLLGVSDPGMRPGMSGVARIDAGERSLLWIYGHRIVDWFRIAAFRWLP